MNDDVPVNVPAEAVPAVPPEETKAVPVRVAAGTQLATLREARGWSIEQVATQLNLASRQIQALESDNYAVLPGMVFVRGFIRAYAKLLRVDATPILAAIHDETVVPAVLPPERTSLSASFSETKLLSGNPWGWPFKTLVGLVILLGVGLLAAAAQRLGWVPALPAMHTEEKLATIEPDIKPAIASAPGVQSDAGYASQPDVNGSNPPVVSPVPESAAPVPAPAKAALVAAPVAAAPIKKTSPAPVEAAAVQNKGALAINVRQDSWVEIRRADNSIVVSRLLKAGASETFDIAGPVSMVIGNASGVDVTLRDTPVDIVAGSASNVARLNLK